MRNIEPHIKALAVLSLLGILCFFATLKAPFVYDDLHAIVENPHIRSLADFQEVVGIQNIFNRSVVLFTYAVNRHLGELDVFGFHLFNLLLHIFVGVVFYFLTTELLALETTERRARLRSLPLVAAAIHLMHPMAVQPVTYLSSRSSILASLFFLLGFYFFIQSLKLWQQRHRRYQMFFCIILVLLCCFLGAGSKEIIVTLPVIVMVYVWLQFPQLGLRKFGLLCLLVLAPLLLYLAYRYLHLGNLFVLKADPESMQMDRVLYFLTQIKVLIFYYLWKLILPLNLNFEPDVRLAAGLFDPEWLTGLAAMICLTAGLYLQKSRLLQFTFLWAFIAFLPTSSFIPLKQIVTEHRAYLPGFGIYLALGLALLAACRNRPVRTGMVMAAFLLLTALLTLNRSLDFRSEIVLWQDTAKKSPRKALVHNNLASAYLAEKMWTPAEAELQRALDLDPGQTDASINLGHLYSQREQWEKARIEFDRAILLGSPKAEAFYNAGLVRIHLNRTEEAIVFFKKAVEMKPQQAKYHFELGNAYRSLSLLDDALQEYRLTLENQPDHLQAHNNRGVIFWNLKQFSLAEEAFQKALPLSDKDPEIHNNLASIYLVQNRYEEAIPHLERLIALQPQNTKAKELLRVAMTMNDAATAQDRP